MESEEGCESLICVTRKLIPFCHRSFGHESLQAPRVPVLPTVHWGPVGGRSEELLARLLPRLQNAWAVSLPPTHGVPWSCRLTGEDKLGVQSWLVTLYRGITSVAC